MKKVYAIAFALVWLSVSSLFAQGTTQQTITFPTITNKYIDNADFLLGATAQSGLPVTYTFIVGSGIASISGDTLKLNHTGYGTVTIRADQAGNGTFAAAPFVTKTFVVSKRSQTTSFIPIPNKYVNAIPFRIYATSTSGLTDSFAIISGPATVSNDTITLTGAAGTVTVSAYQVGNATYLAAPTLTKTFLVSKLAQSISFPVITPKYVNAAKFKLNALASSGYTVSYAVTSGPATISGDSLTLTGTEGTVVVTASQAGDGTYLAAPNTVVSFAVTKIPQGITFANITNKYVNAARFKLGAVASSGLAIAYGVTGPASISNDTLILSGFPGTVVVTADQAGDVNYAAATRMTKTFTVSKIPQTLTFTNILNKYVNAGHFKLLCTSSAGQTVSYSVSGPANLIAGDSIALTGVPGTVTVIASQAGDATYAAATSVTKVFTVTKIQQTISYVHFTVKYLNVLRYKISPVSTSGLAVTSSISGPATISNDTIILNGTPGTVILTLNQAGDSTYAAAPTVLDTFTVVRAAQTIAFNIIPAKLTTSPKFKVTAIATSGLPVTYTISGPATMSNDTVTLTTGNGVVTVTAHQAGDTMFNAAPNASKSFNVAKTSQFITFPALPNLNVASARFKLAATSSSGRTVTYAITGPASISNDTVILAGTVGTVRITASQVGDSTYSAAPSVIRTFVVAIGTQTISWANVPTKYTNSPAFTVSATSSVALPITYSIVSGPASISNDTVTLTGTTGIVVVRASQAGNSQYAAKVSDKSIQIYTPLVPIMITTNNTNPMSTILGDDNSISLYPNPASNFDIININTGSELKSVRIYDVIGNEVYNQQVSIQSTGTKLNLAHLNKGIYFVRVQTSTKELTSRLIIQ